MSTVAEEIDSLRTVQGSHGERIAKVEVKVHGLAEQVRDIRTEVRAGISEGAKPLYRLLLVCIGAIVLFGGMITLTVGAKLWFDAQAGTVIMEGARGTP